VLPRLDPSLLVKIAEVGHRVLDHAALHAHAAHKQ
jgi:hypothetical protein